MRELPLIPSDRLLDEKSMPRWTARARELPPIPSDRLIEVRRI